MSESITYNKSKVDAFLSAYSDFSNNLTTYNETLTNFQEIVNFLTPNFATPDNTIKFFRGTRDGTDIDYIFTNESLIMEVENTFDFQPLTLNSGSIELLYSADNYNKIITITDGGTNSVEGLYIEDKFNNTRLAGATQAQVEEAISKRNHNIQMDYSLMPKIYDNMEDISARLLDNAREPDLSFNNSCDTDMVQECVLDFMYKHRREGRNYYNDRNFRIGLHETDDGECQCFDYSYDASGNEGDRATSRQVPVTPAIYDGASVPMKYFGLFMDGSVMGLKEELYANNFTDFFQVDSNNHISELMTSSNSDLNPYVGHGVHSFNINTFTKSSS